MRTPITGTNPRATTAALACGALLLAACGQGGPSAAGSKISQDKIVLGVLNDQSGVYKDLSGPKSVDAVRMAVEDFKAKYADKAVSKDITVVVRGAGRRRAGQGQEEAVLQHRRRNDRTDQQELQQVHVPLRVRHLHAGERLRHRRDRGRR